MASPDEPSHATKLRAQRDARLAAEMRANLMKRKSLKRSRSADDASSNTEEVETGAPGGPAAFDPKP